MLSLCLVASLTSLTLLPQQPLSQRSPESVSHTRRAALLAGSTMAVSMLPMVAHADAIADIAARSNAAAEDDRLNAEFVKAEKEKQTTNILLAIAGVVLLSPLAGIKSAQNAIKAMTSSDMDEELRASLRGNDPSVRTKGNTRRNQKAAKAEPPPRKKNFWER